MINENIDKTLFGIFIEKDYTIEQIKNRQNLFESKFANYFKPDFLERLKYSLRINFFSKYSECPYMAAFEISIRHKLGLIRREDRFDSDHQCHRCGIHLHYLNRHSSFFICNKCDEELTDEVTETIYKKL